MEGMGDFDSENQPTLKEFFLPDYILVPGSNAKPLSYIPSCPVLVFINSKSGGQLGGNLLMTYRSLLNKAQVFDLGEEAPDKVLHKLYGNLERLKSSSDEFASEIEKRLRLIVAGGDGTASWLLGVVSDLKLTHPPPVATVPLGTGNNLPFSFGWGKKNPGTDVQSVKSFLAKVMMAKGMKIDSWHILMRMKTPEKHSCDPIPLLELPHSLHAVHHVSRTDSPSKDVYHTFRGGFWNYFSMGMDAQVSYAFHSERKLHPEKFKKQIVNQSTYLKLGCTQGWFCASLVHPSSRNIAYLAKVMIMQKQGTWRDLNIPHSIRSIVCLNLPSFSGGLNPWGTPSRKKAQERNLTAPFVDDGLLEIVGFRNGWHGLVLLSPKGHGTRLAQNPSFLFQHPVVISTLMIFTLPGPPRGNWNDQDNETVLAVLILHPHANPSIDINLVDFVVKTAGKAHGIRFVFHKGAADKTYMRLDGEPWKQPLPSNGDTTVVEISHGGQVTMLAMPGCRSKTVKDVVLHPSANQQQEEEYDSDEDSREDLEEKRKFGAADTFRIPDGTDMSHLF